MVTRNSLVNGSFAVVVGLAAAGSLLAQEAPKAPSDQPAQTPATTPSATPTPPAKDTRSVSTRNQPMYDALVEALPLEWEVQRKLLTSKEVAKAFGDDLSAEGHNLCKVIHGGEVMAAAHPSDRQVCMVQILRFPDKERALKFLDMVHTINKARFERESKTSKNTTIELIDDKLNLFGPDSTRRLVIKTTKYGKAGHMFINRFVKDTIYIEVASVVSDPADAIEGKITDVALATVSKL